MSIRYMIGGGCIVLGYVGGCIYSARMKSHYSTAQSIYDALIIMRSEIITYGKGLSSALEKAYSITKCEALNDILNAITSDTNCDEAIDRMDIDATSKNALNNLLLSIRYSDTKDISAAFDDCIKTVSLRVQNTLSTYKKEAMLYKRLGILTGIAIFILLC
ncbi:MAG: hypothetical protein E7312_03525 [Clostridiales bacterium]|nr:hypothetical protein [Clostridiales bacterium]